MRTRALAIWITAQTLLGAWFAWLLWGPPSAHAAGDTHLRQTVQSEAPEVLRSNDAEASRDDAAVRESPNREPVAVSSDPAGLLLFGHITNSRGEPIAEALLSVHHAGEFRGAIESGATGAYAIGGLLRGDARVLIRAKGYRNFNETITSTTESTSERRDFVVQEAVAMDVIARTPEGEPLEPALRAAGMPDQARLRVMATKDRLDGFPASSSLARLGIGKFSPARWYGSLRIPDAPPEMLGRLELDGDPPAYASLVLGNALLAVQPIQGEMRRLEFQLSVDAVQKRFATVRVQLVSAETDRPIGGIRVELGTVQMTDAEGIAAFAGVMPGVLRLRARVPDREPLDRAIQVTGGDRVDLGRIPLHRLRKVRVSIVDARDQPATASVRIFDLDSRTFPQELETDLRQRVDAGGRVELSLGPRRYAIHATQTHETTGKEHAGYALCDMTGEPPKELRVQLQPLRKVKVIKQFSRDHLYLLSIRTPTRLPLYGRTLFAGGPQTLLLPEGRYTVDVHEGTKLIRSYPLTVGPTGAQIRLP